MCGIFGVVIKKTKVSDKNILRSWSDSLFELSESRGKEACGIAISKENKIEIFRQAIRGTKLIGKEVYRSLFPPELRNDTFFIGHSRLATNGFQTENRNNQPVFDDSGVVVHNGIIVNDKYLWEKILKEKSKSEVDTEVILRLIYYFSRNGYKINDSIKKTFSSIEGSASIAYVTAAKRSLYLATNTGSLYFWKTSNPLCLVFASESFILETFLEKQGLGALKNKITQLKAFNGIEIKLSNMSIKKFALKGLSPKPIKKGKSNKIIFKFQLVESRNSLDDSMRSLYGINNDVKKLRKHDFNYTRISKLKRCKECILPETMPLINFDKSGVCNYCRDHKKISPKGKDILLKLVEPYRSKNGKPDCIVAFSGGRDSSYGLHFVKNELGLNPIAYTYDWGMITDLARRNQARLVGKLGIEHIIVSADITYKRDNIRKNILAWLKKPDLGMVPLFMAGDKQAEYYADQVAERSKVKLIFYCRGNELENEEFKWGYCGIKNGSPGGILHNLSLRGKLKIAMYYLRQFVSNPSYINSSILDTAFAYFSAYLKEHDYVYLWHYIEWNEDKIISTLRKEYDWETDPKTNLTWRTDDGTPAFYNYIFYQMQGFTENDTFRSNQIREGILKKGMAQKLADKENRPRYEALKWYFDRVGLDGDRVLGIIDKAKKKY